VAHSGIGQVTVAIRRASHGVHERFLGELEQHVARRARAQSGADPVGVALPREHDYLGVGGLGPDRADRGVSGSTGQIESEHEHTRAMAVSESLRARAAGRRGDDLEIAVRGMQHIPQSPSNARVIDGEDYPDRRARVPPMRVGGRRQADGAVSRDRH
jgi:hypothetical protein